MLRGEYVLFFSALILASTGASHLLHAAKRATKLGVHSLCARLEDQVQVLVESAQTSHELPSVVGQDLAERGEVTVQI